MNKSYFKINLLLLMIYNSFIKLPTPININYWWNFGSILGITLMNQILTGLLLSMHYNSNVNLAFNSIIHIIQNVNYGWLIRLMHMNGASLFFLLMYCHIGRGIYYHSFKLIKPWTIGVMIFMTSMATAFMGYVLPWGQMSFWGATVITNLISTIPYIGQMMVEWIWGGFSVEAPTLSRFYSLHFILPFIITFMVIIHLIFLHEFGSNNPLGLNSNMNKINFNPFFLIKDILGFILTFFIFLMLILINPYILNDPENFIWANPMLTPIHIQPEWYFLFAYTILRSIPNKSGGVIALLMSILILLFLPFMNNFNLIKNPYFYPLNQMLFWMFVNVVILLTWLGSQLIIYPYTLISQFLTLCYFLYFMLNSILMNVWNKIILKL